MVPSGVMLKLACISATAFRCSSVSGVLADMLTLEILVGVCMSGYPAFMSYLCQWASV